MGTFEVRADTVKSRLYIQLVGFFREADVQPTLDALRTEAGKFQGPFDVVDRYSEIPTGLAESRRRHSTGR